MQPSRSIAIALFTALSLGAATPAGANLLANGSFENGGFVNQGSDTMSLAAGSTAIDGWTVVTDTVAWIGPTNPFGLTASAGDYFLDLTNYQAGAPYGGMRQTVATIVGATYLLSFDLGGSNFWGRPDGITATAGATSVTFTTPTTGTNNDWYGESMTFVATSASTTITLQGQSGINYIGLDNAAVELVSLPVPEPPGWLLMAAGLALLVRNTFASVARRR